MCVILHIFYDTTDQQHVYNNNSSDSRVPLVVWRTPASSLRFLLPVFVICTISPVALISSGCRVFCLHLFCCLEVFPSISVEFVNFCVSVFCVLHHSHVGISLLLSGFKEVMRFQAVDEERLFVSRRGKLPEAASGSERRKTPACSHVAVCR